MREYRELWLELRWLTERAAPAWGVCTLHYMVCCISAVLLNGFGLLAAISAPTALAVRMAEEAGLTLAGFVRGGRHVVYSHPQRLEA